MDYQDKLAKVIFNLKEERKLTRKGHKSKVTFDDASFTRVRIDETIKILLILQDDEKILKITEALEPLETLDPYEQENDGNYDNIETISVELTEEFDNWYKNYLIKQKSQPRNLDWLNLLKVLDVCSDIDQQLQITEKDTVIIPSFPYPYTGRFLELFPTDNIGTRKTYQQHRWEGSQYLLKQKIATDVKGQPPQVSGYGKIIIKINLVAFYDFYTIIKNEFDNQKKSFNKKTEKLTSVSPQSKASWSDDFQWDNKCFVFGKLGKICFQSKDRKHLFKTLTDKKGGWAKISELKGNKDDKYLRATIGQIKARLPKTAKKYISVVSTPEDNLDNKPNEGAYRIKYIPKP
jgi:hypothetical protein